MLALLTWAVAAASAGGIEIVLSEESGAYLELAEMLNADLGTQGLRRLSAGTLEREAVEAQAPDLVLALGSRALSAALAKRRAPVVAALVPAESFERLAGSVSRPRGAREVSAVYLDQPARRRLALARLALPHAQRIGVLAGADRETELKRLREAAAALGLTLTVKNVIATQDLYQALHLVLAEADLLLALPDQAVFNSGSIHNILLATYRARVPLLGFSAAYVQAGALAAVYSTPRQLAPQIAELVRRALAGGGLPPPQYPRVFSVSVNPTVARSLGIELGESAQLEASLSALEVKP